MLSLLGLQSKLKIFLLLPVLQFYKLKNAMSYNFKHKSPNPYFPEVTDVHAQEVFEQKQHLKLIDVREHEEYTGDLGHASDTVLIPLGQFANQLQQFNTTDPLVIICRSGNRSAHAAAYAISQGYKTVYNMAGGMMAWNQLQLPLEK